jgi:hypothetical protein
MKADTASALAYHLVLLLHEQPQLVLVIKHKPGHAYELRATSSRLGPNEDKEEYGGAAMLVQEARGAPTLIRSRTAFELLKQLLLMHPTKFCLRGGKWSTLFQRSAHPSNVLTLDSFLATVNRLNVKELRGSALPELCFQV